MAYVVVSYTLPADYFERRGPYKDGHMRCLQEAAASGGLVIAGAWGDPVAGATYVFDSLEAAEAFVRIDPYATGGVASAWTLAPWHPVVGPGAAS